MRRTIKSTLHKAKVSASWCILHALAHPLRISILEYIDIHKSISVNSIYGALHLEQSVTSHHLSILRNAGIVATIRDGKYTYYSINYRRVEKAVCTADVISAFVDIDGLDTDDDE